MGARVGPNERAPFYCNFLSEFNFFFIHHKSSKLFAPSLAPSLLLLSPNSPSFPLAAFGPATAGVSSAESASQSAKAQSVASARAQLGGS